MIRIGGQLFAHRGLHSPGGPPENSIESFLAAEQGGYGIELDVRLTRDGELAVIHDADTGTTTEESMIVEQSRYGELKELSLGGTESRIPTLGGVLEALRPTTPLLVEVKPSPSQSECAAKVVEVVSPRLGSTAVQSFHPAVVRRVKKDSPRLLVGQIGGIAPEIASELSTSEKLFLTTLFTNPWAKPDFLSLEISYLTSPPARFWRRVLGCAVLAWTIRDSAAYAKSRELHAGTIFDGFRPTAVALD